MKAVQLVRVGGPLEEREVPLPEPAANDVLIRVRAAGICHTDEHYRAGDIPVPFLPVTLGHEVAGIVERVGGRVKEFRAGNRVCVHYLATCGTCPHCLGGNEQFCPSGQMIGKHRHGGYAEYLLMPGPSVVALPEEISFENGAVMMCSTATAFHALRKGRLGAGEKVAVFGAGGLGISAVQIARFLGASEVYAVDIRKEKLEAAKSCGAIPVNGGRGNPAAQIRDLTNGAGVDVALEMAGLLSTAKQAVKSLGKLGRAVMVGLTDKPFDVRVYSDLLGNEAEIIGSSDHLRSELPQILEIARQGKLDFSRIVTRSVPLEAGAINAALDALRTFRGDVRTVIVS